MARKKRSKAPQESWLELEICCLETPYNHTLYRSRSEAREAVFLEETKNLFTYNKKDYSNEDEDYQTDFLIEGVHLYRQGNNPTVLDLNHEVKGYVENKMSAFEKRKIVDFVRHGNNLFLVGKVPDGKTLETMYRNIEKNRQINPSLYTLFFEGEKYFVYPGIDYRGFYSLFTNPDSPFLDREKTEKAFYKASTYDFENKGEPEDTLNLFEAVEKPVEKELSLKAFKLEKNKEKRSKHISLFTTMSDYQYLSGLRESKKISVNSILNALIQFLKENEDFIFSVEGGTDE